MLLGVCLHRLTELDALELELQVIMNRHVGAGNQTWLLWKSSQCSNCRAISPVLIQFFFV